MDPIAKKAAEDQQAEGDAASANAVSARTSASRNDDALKDLPPAHDLPAPTAPAKLAPWRQKLAAMYDSKATPIIISILALISATAIPVVVFALDKIWLRHSLTLRVISLDVRLTDLQFLEDRANFNITVQFEGLLTNTGNSSSAFERVFYVIPEGDLCPDERQFDWDYGSGTQIYSGAQEGWPGRQFTAIPLEMKPQVVPSFGIVAVSGEMRRDEYSRLRENFGKWKHTCMAFLASDSLGERTVKVVPGWSISIGGNTYGQTLEGEMKKPIRLLPR